MTALKKEHEHETGSVCLSVDTSGPICLVTLSQDRKVLAAATLNIGRTHSRSLSPLIESLLQQAEYSVDDIAVYAAVTGPGSFTGLRIGVATVQGLAFASDKPTVAVSSLEAFAQRGPVLEAGDTDLSMGKSHWHLPLIDARNRRAYYALFKGKRVEQRVWPDSVGGIDAMWDQLEEHLQPGDSLWLTGSGAAAVVADSKIHDRIAKLTAAGTHIVIREGVICPSALARLTARDIGKQAVLKPEDLQPVYLAPTQAERQLEAKQLEAKQKE